MTSTEKTNQIKLGYRMMTYLQVLAAAGNMTTRNTDSTMLALERCGFVTGDVHLNNTPRIT